MLVGPDGDELSTSEEGDADEDEEESPPPEPTIYPPLAPGFMRVRRADGKARNQRSCQQRHRPHPLRPPSTKPPEATLGLAAPSAAQHCPAPPSTVPALTCSARNPGYCLHLPSSSPSRALTLSPTRTSEPGVLPAPAQPGRRVVAAVLRATRAAVRDARGLRVRVRVRVGLGLG